MHIVYIGEFCFSSESKNTFAWKTKLTYVSSTTKGRALSVVTLILSVTTDSALPLVVELT